MCFSVYRAGGNKDQVARREASSPPFSFLPFDVKRDESEKIFSVKFDETCGK